MDELIARIEAATEGSRELDAEVLRAIGWDTAGGRWRNPHKQYIPVPPSPTTSIDAALTLVPEGWGYEMSALPGEKVLARPVKPCPDGSIETMSRWHSHANIPALAICAAALKARKEEG